MPRVTLTKTTAPGAYSGASVAVTMTAADAVNFEQFTCTGRELVIIHNTGAGARTWTATSVDDSYGRSENITTESIAAGAIRVWGPVALEGWVQTNGYVYLQAEHAEVKFGIITLP